MKAWNAAVRAIKLVAAGSESFGTLIGQAFAVIVVAGVFSQIAIIVFVLPRWGVWLEVAGALIAFAGALLVVPEFVESARRFFGAVILAFCCAVVVALLAPKMPNASAGSMTETAKQIWGLLPSALVGVIVTIGGSATIYISAYVWRNWSPKESGERQKRKVAIYAGILLLAVALLIQLRVILDQTAAASVSKSDPQVQHAQLRVRTHVGGRGRNRLLPDQGQKRGWM
jgi:hypothetical protein